VRSPFCGHLKAELRMSTKWQTKCYLWPQIVRWRPIKPVSGSQSVIETRRRGAKLISWTFEDITANERPQNKLTAVKTDDFARLIENRLDAAKRWDVTGQDPPIRCSLRFGVTGHRGSFWMYPKLIFHEKIYAIQYTIYTQCSILYAILHLIGRSCPVTPNLCPVKTPIPF
jgi:hypothetical protein